MICSVRSVVLLPVVLTLGASFCLAQTGSITRIEENDAERAWIFLDAFDIQDGMGVAGGLPAATAGRIENDNPVVTYKGFWNLNAGPRHSGGTAVLAVDPFSAVSLTFNGTGIQWIGY